MGNMHPWVTHRYRCDIGKEKYFTVVSSTNANGSYITFMLSMVIGYLFLKSTDHMISKCDVQEFRNHCSYMLHALAKLQQL